MNYQVLARKWRPRNFQTLVGQEHVVRALVNSLDQNRLHQAYLFTGTRGVGKTTIARIIAKCLNCEAGVSSTPCGSCNSCQEIDAGRFIDLLEIDAASRTKVEDTRELLENVQYSPTKGRYKVYLIDEVHMLSGHSFNALLKTLEEPPPHVKFLLATTDPQKLPVTVLSRCLQFHLKSLPPERIAAYLNQVLNEEQIAHEDEALQLLARTADGSMRDALSLLDQGIAYGNGSIKTADIKAMLGSIEQTHFLDILAALAENNANAILTIVAQLAEQAVDFTQALENLLSLLHQLAVIQAIPEAPIAGWDNPQQLQTLAQRFTGEEVQLYYQIGLIGRRDLPYAPTPKTGFEMVLLRMLAFQPENITSVEPKTTSKTMAIPKPAETPSLINKPVMGNSPISKPVNDSVNKTAAITSATGNPLPNQNWTEILPQLNLTGASRALALHCTANINADAIALWLDPTQAPLLTDKQKQRITDALHDYFKRPIRVSIQVGKSETGDKTPAALVNKRLTERQTQATHSIANDKNVQAIINTFNATIVPESTKAID